MTAPLREPKVRIQLDLTASQAERYDQLVRDCELGSRKELFNVAMSLFNWAVQEVSKGNKVAAYDERDDHVETILVPALDAVRPKVAANDSIRTEHSRDRRSFEVVPAEARLAEISDLRSS